MFRNLQLRKDIKDIASKLEEFGKPTVGPDGKTTEPDPAVETFLKRRLIMLLHQYFGEVGEDPSTFLKDASAASLRKLAKIALEHKSTLRVLIENAGQPESDRSLDAVVQASFWRSGTLRIALIGLGLAYSVALALLGFGAWSTNEAAETAQDIVQQAQEKLEAAGDSLRHVTDLNDGVDERIQEFNTRFTATGNRVDELNRQIEGISTDAVDKLAELDRTLVEKQVLLNRRILDAEIAFSAVEPKVNEIVAKHAAAVIAIDAGLQSQLANARTSVGEINNRLVTLQSDMGTLELVGVKISELNERLTNDSREAGVLESRLGTLSTQMSDELARLKAEISNLLSQTEPALQLAEVLADQSTPLADSITAAMALTNESLAKRLEFLLYTREWLLFLAIAVSVLFVATILIQFRFHSRLRTLSKKLS